MEPHGVFTPYTSREGWRIFQPEEIHFGTSQRNRDWHNETKLNPTDTTIRDDAGTAFKKRAAGGFIAGRGTGSPGGSPGLGDAGLGTNPRTSAGPPEFEPTEQSPHQAGGDILCRGEHRDRGKPLGRPSEQ